MTATKAAERARHIAEQFGFGGDEVYQQTFKDLVTAQIEEHEAATIERCAQIADGLQAEAESQVREFRRLSLSGCAMQSQSEMTAYRSAAAAIRSMGDAK